MSRYISIQYKAVLITAAVALGLALTPSPVRAASDATPSCGGEDQKFCSPSKAKRLVNKFREQPSGTKKARGSYWSCPSGYKKIVTRKWNSDKACKKKSKRSKAKNHGPVQNAKPSGSFLNAKTKAYWSCPSGYFRKPLAKIESSKACIPKLGNKCDGNLVAFGGVCNQRNNPKFVKFASKEAKEYRKKYAEVIKQAKLAFKKTNTKENRKKRRRLKTKAKRRAFNAELNKDFRAWLKAWQKNNRKASLNVRVASASPDDPTLWATQLASTGDNEILTLTTGWVVDGSFGIGYTSAPEIIAKDISGSEDGEIFYYKGHAITFGASLGFDGSPEFGFWTDKASELAGESHGITAAAALGGGISASFWWSYPRDGGRFLGFTVSPQIGVGAELEYARSITIQDLEND